MDRRPNHPNADAVERYPSLDAGELRRMLRTGVVTSADLVRAFRRRYETVDQSGPAVNAVSQLSALPDMDGSAGSGRPLAGVPVLVKDCIDVADGHPTTCGSLALAQSTPSREATVVGRLRQAGAVIVGRANLSEWGNFRSRRSSSGWSAFGGLTRNPYALDRSPGGSSSGSAAAVAAGLVPVAVGTETHGSVICPSAACGVVGVKTTVGLVAGDGVQPVAPSQDTVGVMARCVVDAASALAAIAGTDRAVPDDYIGAVSLGIDGVRIGVARTTSWGRHPGLDERAERALSALSKAGAVIVDHADIPTAAELEVAWEGVEARVLLAQFGPALEKFLSGRRGGPKTLADLVAFNAVEPKELQWFGQEIFEAALDAEPVGSAAYRAAASELARISRHEGIDAALGRADVEVLVAPTMPPAWKIDLINGDPAGFDSAAAAPAIAGYPAVTVPLGLVEWLPVGLTVIGRPWSEAMLLRVAAAIEQGMGRCPAPGFRAPDPG